MILLTNDVYSHKFVMEWETFLFNIKNKEIDEKSKKLLGEKEEKREFNNYLKEASLQKPKQISPPIKRI